MKTTKIKISDIFLAALSGALTALSFPKFKLSFLCWISLFPLFFILLKKRPKTSFFLGLIAGFSFYAVLLYWIPSVPAHYGGLSTGFSLITYIFFMLFLGLFWALFALVFSKIHQSFSESIFFLAPFLWVSFEYIITHILTGFPWGLIGYSQYQNIYFIQMASVTGIYGVSFALVLVQSLFLLFVVHKKKPPFFFALSLILLIYVAGYITVKSTPKTEDTFKASVIQGNISSEIDWNKKTDEEIRNLFDRHLTLSRKAVEEGSRLIVWAELSVPLCFSCPYGIYEEFKEKIYQFVQETDSTILLGTNEVKKSPEGNSYYNAAIGLNPDHSTTQYNKMHLVPFGEYTPYKKVFSFISKFTHAIGELEPGSQYNFHFFRDIKYSSPICYEIIFPDLVRKFIKKGGSFLITITNDGWYGKSSAPFQHFCIAVFRAVENRRYLLRSATTGISGIIDPYGRILRKSALDEETFLTENITPLQKITLYTRFGDVLPIAGLTISALFLILALIKRRNERKKQRIHEYPSRATDKD